MSDVIRVAELPGLVGTEIGVSDWLEIDQERVDAFADATLDYQFIHVDPVKAAATPFGGTIAHGFLTLALIPHFLESIAPVIENTLFGMNYGTDKVRFLQPVKVGSRIRATNTLAEVTEKRPGQWLLRQTVTIEIEGETKPAVVAEVLVLVFVG